MRKIAILMYESGFSEVYPEFKKFNKYFQEDFDKIDLNKKIQKSSIVSIIKSRL